MQIIYVLLSPTLGMHQYTADLANRIADGAHQRWNVGTFERSNVQLVTTTTLPRDRYSPEVRIETPITSHGTGFAREGLDVSGYRRVNNVLTFKRSNVRTLIHFTGVHAWNVPLVYALHRRGIPVIHTLHDLHPHGGVRHGALIRLWNRLIIGSGAHILVHGRRYRDELIARGLPPQRVTYTPLLHGFWGYEGEQRSRGAEGQSSDISIRNQQSAILSSQCVLFFGRVEAYKGVDVLLAAWESLQGDLRDARLMIAGPAAAGVTLPPLPRGVERRDRRIDDAEGIDLFRSACLLVLPYRDATQSALVAAAYTFGLPVIVTETGALPEYVVGGETGWVVPPGDSPALAGALRAALADPERLSSMGRAGRAWVAARRSEEEAGLWQMYVDLTQVSRAAPATGQTSGTWYD
jgi:glycosyltransferase involved in cell wall biosynthesis